ncbi:MAG TPA: TetR/AcrR family transcriptional regulator [Solirubrobacterales bacterium]|jgi:AcrR family transcriptional regulator
MICSCAEKTYPATTIGDVVAGAHISRTTFYREFEDKRDCFDAALEQCIEEVWAAAIGACSAGEPAPRAVRRATAAVLGLLAARPELAHLLVGEAVAVEPAVVERYRDLVVPAISRLWGDGADDNGRHQLDPWLAFGRAQLLIFDRVTAGGAARLPELLPEIVYLAVAPFAGHDAAIEEARACWEPLSSGAAR